MLSLVDILIVAAFLVVTLAVGLFMKRHDKTAAGYILGGRALTLPAFVATTVSTWYGGILGVGEYAWTYGISNWIVFGVPYYVGALLFALLFSKRARAGDCLTIPHRFESHYDGRTARCAGILIFLTTVPGAYVLIMGTLCALSFGLSAVAGIAMTVIFVVLYLWRGGFGAVVKTDEVQFLLMFGSFALLTLWLLCGYGTDVLAILPETHLDPTGGQPLASILVWYVIALSTLAEPNFFQRSFAAKTPEIARNGMLISIVCWLIFDLMTTICGLYARALLPNLENPMYAFPALAVKVLPIGLIGIFFSGLFATVLSSLDSNLFTSAATFGRDLWPKNLTPTWKDERKTRVGIVISALLAAGIAWAAGSVISIWKIFGSVSAAALLIPILTTWYPRFKMSNTGVLVLMLLSAGTTIVWFVSKPLLGAYCLGLEPLFAGGIVSVACFAVDHIRLWRQNLRAANQSRTPDHEGSA